MATSELPPERIARPCPLEFNCWQMGLQADGHCRNLRYCVTWADRLHSTSEPEHELDKQDKRWSCRTCGYIWKSRPQSLCPQMQQYGPHRPYPGVVATRSELQQMGLLPTRLPVGVAWNRLGKRFYELYDLKAVRPALNSKVRICRVCRLWKGQSQRVERSWKGKPDGIGYLEKFYTYEEAQKLVAKLQSRPQKLAEETWSVERVPGLPEEF